MPIDFPKSGLLRDKDYAYGVPGTRGIACLEHGLLLSGTVPLDCMELGLLHAQTYAGLLLGQN